MALSGTALAGAQYVDETGYAISGYDAVAYFKLPQDVPGVDGPISPQNITG